MAENQVPKNSFLKNKKFLYIAGTLIILFFIGLANPVKPQPNPQNQASAGDASSQQTVSENSPQSEDQSSKEASQKELDRLMDLSKAGGLVVSYEFSDSASVVYVGKVWYDQTVTFKKDFLAKIGELKKAIRGYQHFEVKDAYSNEKVAEITPFSGSLEVYK